jgi:2-(1,2-epoxy-1,2-dihydrophenyl)acetyl-CoA isomerase
MISYGKLRIDEPAPRVMRLLIDRPEKRNAIDYDVRQQLIEVLTDLPTHADTRALVLGGTHGHFSAGGDLPSMVDLSESEARSRLRHIAHLCRLISTTGIPVVTSMEGFSAGACIGLALFSDYIVAGKSTKILFPFMKLGLVPDWGMLYTLPRRVGLAAARRLLTSEGPVSGEEAQRLGLADEIVGDEEVMPTVVRRAAELARLPQAAFARMKRRLTCVSTTLDEELGREEEDQSLLLRGEDFREGYTAFVEKRKADFTRPDRRQK